MAVRRHHNYKAETLPRQRRFPDVLYNNEGGSDALESSFPFPNTVLRTFHMLQITWKEQKCARQREGTFSGKSQKEKVTRIKYFSHLAPKCVISIRSSLKWREFIAATSTLVIVSRRDRRPSGLTALADCCCVYFFVLFYELCNRISLKGHRVLQWLIAVAQKQTKRKKKALFIKHTYLGNCIVMNVWVLWCQVSVN